MNELDTHFSIAIDGPSGAGKSTIAQAVAQATGALYLDTGAMYRAVALGLIHLGIDPHDVDAVSSAINDIWIDVRYDGGHQRVYLDGEDVTDAIREPDVSLAASISSAVVAVRERLVAMQRTMAVGHDVVMDGRDIGTKVMPDATLKIYLVATPEERALRRYRELAQKGLPDSYQQVLADMLTRDHDDSTRAASPLKKAHDAIEIDSSALSLEETVERVLSLLHARMDGGSHDDG